MANNDDGSKWAVSSAQFSTHFTYYHRITPSDTFLQGGRAREFFLQTKLPPTILSQIWKLSDVDQDGALNAAEFFVAMTFVQHSLTGSALPPSLPSQLHTIVQKSVNPQLPVADENHLRKCQKAFKAFQSNIGVGVLGGDAAKYIFSKSNLTKNQLYHIWKLSDIDQDGHLSFLEFTIAMHLIFVAKIGYILPIDLDPNTILPPSFYQVVKSVQAEANQLPRESNPSHISNGPFSPPTTPIHPAHTTSNNNPFSTDEFFNLPAQKFREGNFDDFTGNPFVGFEMKSTNLLIQDKQIESDELNSRVDETDSPLPEKHQLNLMATSNGHASPSASSGSEGLSREEREEDQRHQVEEIVEEESHDYYILESPLQQHPPNSSSLLLSNGKPGRTGMGKRRDQQGFNENPDNSDDHAHTSSMVVQHQNNRHKQQRSGSPTSHREDVSSHQSGDALKLHDVSSDPAPSPTWYVDKDSPQEPVTPTSTTPTSSFSQDPITVDVVNGTPGSLKDESSSPAPSSSTSSPSSVRRGRKKYQELTISERTEPILQVATAVDVIGSREATPTPDGGAKMEVKKLSPEDVAEEMESLSRASRKLLHESQDRLEEQKRRNVPQQPWFGMEEYKAASMRGLSATIQEMESSNPSDDFTEPVKQDQDSTVNTNSRVDDFDGATPDGLEADVAISDDDVMSHLEDLEAEIMAALADEDFDFEDDDELERREESLSATPTSLSPSVKAVSFETQRDKTPSPPPPPFVKPKVRFTPFNHSGVTGEGRGWAEPGDDEVVRREFKTGSAVPASQTTKRKSVTAEELMEDLDDILGEEMASFQEVFEQFQVKDQKAKERNKHEQEELQTLETKTRREDTTDVGLAGSMDEVTKRRTQESHVLQEQWEQEMKKIEEERLRALEQQEMDKERTLQTDATLMNLDDELKLLIEHEEKAVKEAQLEKELRLQREKEEKERREKERLERLAQEGPQTEEMTVDEWIKWMEAEKTKGMTPAQMEEYQRRKERYVIVAKEREEKRKREEEEQKEKIRRMMMEDQRAYQTRSKEVEATRLESEELAAKNKEELTRKNSEESKVRVEKGKQMRAAMRQWEDEMSTPKARSALAARFEETVRARSDGKLSGRKDSKTTVMSVNKSALEREEQRMLRRMSNGTRAEVTSQTKQDNRKSLQ